MRRLCVWLILALPMPTASWATAYTASASGNYNSSATWGGVGVPTTGDTFAIGSAHTVTCNDAETFGTSPVAGTIVGQVNSTGVLVLASGCTLTSLGDLAINGGTLNLQGGGVLNFDPSSAAAPTTTSYRLLYEANGLIETSSTSSSSHAIIQLAPAAVTAGYKAPRISYSTGAGTITVHYLDLNYNGDTVNDALDLAWGSSTVNHTLDWVTLNHSSVIKDILAPSTGQGWVVTFLTTQNTNAPKQGNGAYSSVYLIATTSPTGSAQRLISDSVLDTVPTIGGYGAIYTRNVFPTWVQGNVYVPWTEFDYNLILANTPWGNSGNVSSSTPVTNNYYFQDNWPLIGTNFSSTVTSAASNTLTDTTQSWATNQWVNSSIQHCTLGSSGGTGYTVGDVGKDIYVVQTQATNGFCVISAVTTGAVTGISNPAAPQGFGYIAANNLTTIPLDGSGALVNITSTSANTGVAAEVEITGGTGKGQIRGVKSNTANTLTLQQVWFTVPDATSTYTMYAGYSNPHMLTPTQYATGGTIANNVFEFNGTSDQGDCILPSQLNTPYVVTGNITLPNGGMENPCTGFNVGSLWQGAWSSTTNYPIVADAVSYIDGCSYSSLVTNNLNNLPTNATYWSKISCTAPLGPALNATHNTWYGGAQSPVAGDFSSASYLVATHKSNLIWTYNWLVESSGTGEYKMADMGHSGGGGTVIFVDPANADYNGCWNCLAGYYSGNGYDIYTGGVTAGAHDVNMSGGTGPNFVDATRNFETYAQHLGGCLGTDLPQVCEAAGVAGFKARTTGYDVASLLVWIRAGFAPQNIALHNTAADGTDIGAVPYAGPGSATPNAGSTGSVGSTGSTGVN